VADDVMRKAAADAHTAPRGAVLAARPESRADRARRLVYRGRFATFYVLLAVVGGAAVGALVVLVSQGSPAPAQAWAEWAPEGSAERKAALIGEHVGDTYRLPTGRALAPVTYAGPPTVTGPDGSLFQVRALAVQPASKLPSADASDVDTFAAANTVMYTLCGLGNACSIPGAASVERGALLRRQSLELALYSFKYIDGIDTVLALLPPRADGEEATAVFIERRDVRAELDRPLELTLTAPLTPGVGEMSSEELRAVDRLTRARLYEYTYLQAQDGSPVMVLSPALES
jgi:hypothetical protein